MKNKWKGCGFFAMLMTIFKKILAQPRTAVSFPSSSVPRHPVGSGARPVVVLRGGFGRSEWSKAPFSASSSAPSSKIFISKLKNKFSRGVPPLSGLFHVVIVAVKFEALVIAMKAVVHLSKVIGRRQAVQLDGPLILAENGLVVRSEPKSFSQRCPEPRGPASWAAAAGRNRWHVDSVG